MKTTIGFSIFMAFLVFAFSGIAHADDGDKALRRYALVVGSNDGGLDRVKLRYATRDALSFVRVMKELGALDDADLVVLLDPKASEMREGFRTLKDKIAHAQKDQGRKEAVIYYSGHSDEEGLLLSGEMISYADIRSLIAGMDVNVRVAILDSCSSGAFTRAKGVIKRPAFLIDSSSETKGYAFLTSSAEDEIAQESDKIEGSFFTHYLVSGLRGAADSTKDGLVTLNEAYSYAFRETLQRTEKTQYGAQHPKYDIQLTGTGDLVLTDLRELTCGLVINEDLEGKFFVRDSSGNLIAEINKLPGNQVELGIEPGSYEITAEIKGKLYRTGIVLAQNKHVIISRDKMQRTEGETTSPRGDGVYEEKMISSNDPGEGLTEESDRSLQGSGTESVTFDIFNLSIIPFVSGSLVPGAYNLSIGLLTSNVIGIYGGQFAPIGNFVTLDVTGAQCSGVFNITGNDVVGTQAAGVFNIAGNNVTVAQAAGVFNIAGNDVTGAQVAGIFNIASGEVWGAQCAGIANVTTGITCFVQTAGIVNYASGLEGVQVAGIGNILSAPGYGAQVSGIFNAGNDFYGVQVASIVNVSGGMYGAQIGLVNIANRVSGLQIGLVNIAGGFDAGFPIGLVNLSRDGTFAFDVWYDDAGYTTFDFRSGSDRIYSILNYSFVPDSEPLEWSYGAGLGITFPFGPFYADVDATLNAMQEGFDRWDRTAFSSLLPRVSLTCGFKIWRFGVYGGVGLGLEFPGMYRESNPSQVYEIPLSPGGEPLYIVPHWFAGIRF